MLLKVVMPVLDVVLPEIVLLTVAQKFGCWHSLCSSSSKSGVPKPVTYGWNTKSIKVEMKRKGTNGIPSLDGAESFGFAPRIRARRNVNEAFMGITIKPGVEEAERLLALGDHEVIQKRNNARHGLYVGDQPHA